METVFAARGKLYTDRGCVELSANGGLFYRSLYGCYTKDNKQRVARFANHSYVNQRVVSETQCIKDEIFAYRAESARQNCGVLGIVTSIW